MKQYLLPLLAICALFLGCAEKPAPRLTIAVKNVIPSSVIYAPALDISVANSRRATWTKNELGEYDVDIPESDSILFVRIEFMRATGHFQSLPFFLMPGEHVRVTGKMMFDFFDYDIQGSPAFEELVKHRREAYMEYERTLADISYDPSDPYTYTPEAEKLLDKIDSIKIVYMIENPDSELSALYFTSGLESPQTYELLGEKLKNGRFKPLLDHWVELGRQMNEGVQPPVVNK